MQSLVDSCRYSDWGSNAQSRRIRMMFLPTEPPSQGFSLDFNALPSSLGSGSTKILGIYSSIFGVLCFRTENLIVLFLTSSTVFAFCMCLETSSPHLISKFPVNNSAKCCAQWQRVVRHSLMEDGTHWRK